MKEIIKTTYVHMTKARIDGNGISKNHVLIDSNPTINQIIS